MNTASKLRISYEDKQYRELLSKFRKLSLSGQFNYSCTFHYLQTHTADKLTANGFKIKMTETDGYKTILISW